MNRKYGSEDATALDFSLDWKSLFPINSIHNAPLLRSSPSIFGPLMFNPVPKTVTPLVSSPSISPLLELTTASRLSLSRFIYTSNNPASFLPPTLANSLSTSGTSDDYDSCDGMFALRSNRLQLLDCPGNKSVMLFFPVGENFDQVGFVKLVVKNGRLSACGAEDGDGAVTPFKDKKMFDHKIVKMLVNPIEEDLVSVGCGNLEGCIGTLMICTLYSVHWFGVKMISGKGLSDGKSHLVYFGGKQFKSSRVADAAWSPHCPEESVVLLESGELFLFDLNRFENIKNSNGMCKGRKFTTMCEESGGKEKHKWFCCEFSWHPRILVAGHQDAIFLLDLRLEEKRVSCLARNEDLRLKNRLLEKDRFNTLARAGSDGFQFVVASKYLLTIIDSRKPLMPVLQWHHNLDEPTYIDVHRLSDLRSGRTEDSYSWATGAGSCIILGSFWHNEFSIFCYGPAETTSTETFISKISEVSQALYAWELPSDLILTDNDCRCGSCLISYEFVKDALPKWAAWQKKKEITLGFGMIHPNMSSLLSEAHESGGFTLIRLLSSGKLESQRYSASWKLSNGLGKNHGESLKNVGDDVLLPMDQENYKFPRRFKYSKLDYLYAYLNGDLKSHLVSNHRRPFATHRKTDFCNVDSMLQKLKSSGLGMPKSITDVLEDVYFPSSIIEVAVKKMWTNLPLSLLQLAFSDYSELLEVLVDKKESSLEILPLPEEPQLPPFFGRKCSERSNKWSGKVKRGCDLVGPLLPLPVLAILHKASVESSSVPNQMADFSFDCELLKHCIEVKEAAKELAITIKSNGNSVTTLGNNEEDTANGSLEIEPFSGNRDFIIYTRSPAADDHYCSTSNSEQGIGGSVDYPHATYISKLHKSSSKDTMEDSEQEHLTDHCPVDLKFQRRVIIGKEGKRPFSVLKRKLTSLFAGVNSYQEMCKISKNHKKR